MQKDIDVRLIPGIVLIANRYDRLAGENEMIMHV